MLFFARRFPKKWAAAWTIGTIVAALIPLSACLLTTDLNGITGTRPVDAGEDSFVVVDSSTDAGAPDAGFSCTGHTLCSTFDNGSLTAQNWKLQILGSATATLDGTEFTSAPDAFRSVLPTNTTTVHWDAILFQTLTVPTNYTTLTYAFDLRITACVSSGPAITLIAMNPIASDALGLLINKSGMQFSETVLVDGGTNSTPATLLSQPPTGSWIRVTMVVANPANPTVDLYLGPDDVLPAHAITPFTPGTGVLLNIGTNAVGPSSECDVAYDNVTFDRQ